MLFAFPIKVSQKSGDSVGWLEIFKEVSVVRGAQRYSASSWLIMSRAVSKIGSLFIKFPRVILSSLKQVLVQTKCGLSRLRGPLHTLHHVTYLSLMNSHVSWTQQTLRAPVHRTAGAGEWCIA